MEPTRLLALLLLASFCGDYVIDRSRDCSPLNANSPMALPSPQTLSPPGGCLAQTPSRVTVSTPALSIGLMCCYVLKSCFCVSTDSLFLSILSSDVKSNCNPKVFKVRCMILLLLLLSGNIEPNPGPGIDCIQTPADFKLRSGLGII